MGEFKLWLGGDAHVGTDLRNGRKSLAEAILLSENGGDEGGPSFEWDIMFDVGDLSGSQTPPDDEEGEEVIAQYSVSTKHPREHFYNIVGNHDASGPNEPTQWWFQKWVDPMGKNTQFSGIDASKRPYSIEGNWARYKFEVGNMVFLCMGDRNDGGPPVGRGERGGYPAGAVSLETFEWWKTQVLANRDKIVITAHHHMLKETTVGSGDWEGMEGQYHGRFEDGAPIGASYLYWVEGERDTGKFESFLESNSGAVDLWFGGHTHTHPDDIRGGRSHIEKKWGGTTFINCASMSKYHAGRTTIAMSRHLTFTPGSAELCVKCYMHTSDYAPQGWFEPAERVVTLSRPFAW
ncbi:MAG: hypothetical protein ACI8V2_001792 [Candidatus Latescibacterota bacterium]